MSHITRPSKLIAISRVRNEADIIEPFVRHHSAHFDKILILDDGSTDQTLEMLHALRAEGLPLVVLQESAMAYEQSRYMTRLLHMAVHQFGADWVAPLDADEFIEMDDESITLRDVLRGRSPELLSMFWTNFACPPDSEQNFEPNPVQRQRLRMPPCTAHPKVLVPARLVSDGARLIPGNHGLRIDDQDITQHPVRELRLCHFPIRSPEQYASKIAVGYLKYRATEGWTGDLAFHYVAPFQSLVSGGVQSIGERMLEDSRSYGSRGLEALSGQEGIDRPLAYRGGPLKLRPSLESTLKTTLSLATAMAEALVVAGKRNRETTMQAELLRRTVEDLRGEMESARTGAAAHVARESAAQDQIVDELLLVERRAAALELELVAARELNFLLTSRPVAPKSLVKRLWTGVVRRLFPNASELRTIRTSPFFDAAFYLSMNPDVASAGMDPAAHYLRYGASEGRSAGPRFDTREYLARYPDVAAAKLNPLVHFERYGRDEHRIATSN